MKGDFTRDTFDPGKHFSRVLMQQGRAQLDTDWNEQTSIMSHLLRALAKDVFGPHWGPREGAGFEIIVDKAKFPADMTDAEKDRLLREEKFLIGPGHYYVDGILCENDDYASYVNQPHLTLDQHNSQLERNTSYVVYLDVWERHITYLEDDGDLNIREVALGGPDTATRAKVVWQIKAVKFAEAPADATKSLNTLREQLRKARRAKDVILIEELTEKIRFLETEPRNPDDIVAELLTVSNATLRARAIPAETADDPCEIPPDARYRGVENQLYRVEIHSGSFDENGALNQNRKPTFKWSRENGSVVFPIIDIGGDAQTTTVTLASLGRDARFGLSINDFVEIVDDSYALENRAENLLQVSAINFDDASVTLKGATSIKIQSDPSNHLLLRRWDHAATKGVTLGADNALLVGDGTVSDNEEIGWIMLERGLQIQFQPNGVYRTGDYWLIPARTVTGDVEWPKMRKMIAGKEQMVSRPMTPRGVIHHYAPLAKIGLDGNGDITILEELRLRRGLAE